MEQQKLQTYFLLSLVLGSAALVFYIFLPYFGALFLGATFGIIFYPFYKKVLRFLGGREIVASLTTVFAIFVLLLVPVSFFGFQIFQESTDLYNTLTQEGGGSFINSIEGAINNFLPGANIDLNQYGKRAGQWLVQNISVIFSGIATFFVTLFLSLFAFYYFLKDGHKLKSYLIKLSPLRNEDDSHILKKLEATVNSVIRGALSVAFVQGILTGLGFAIFGIPNPALWGGIAFISALIPSVGTALVLVPGILYLFLTAGTFNAVGLLVWGIVAVGLVDNILGPKLMQRGGVPLHPFLILLSVLGGLQLFGVIGFVVGPLVLSFFATIVDVYAKEFKLG